MPTTNPYGYDQKAADINQGSKPSTDTSYVTQNPTTTSNFGTPQPTQSPPSFGGAGSALATTTDFGSQPKMPAPPTYNYPGLPGGFDPSKPPPSGTAPAPGSWTPPPTGFLSVITTGIPPGYNSPTPPPGAVPPQGMSWVTDGQGRYGWGMPNQPWTDVLNGTPATLAPAAPASGNMLYPLSTSTNPAAPVPGSSPLPTSTQWNNLLPPAPAPPTTDHQPVLPTPTQWPQPTQTTEQPGKPFVGSQPVMPTATQWMNPIPGPTQGPPPWSVALNGGYPEAAFTNPGGGSIPSTQQYWAMNPMEQAAVASLNWSVNGMDAATFQDYMRKSAPQWNTPAPATYRSY